jgi:hypothetical protein
MSERLWCVFTGLCSLLVLTVCVAPAGAQMPEVKPKPAMYSYVANWQFPRASFADVDKMLAGGNPALDKAYADGAIIGYGHDKNLVHSVDGWTHDTWWSATSIAGLMKALSAVSATDMPNSAAMTSASKHWDEVLESHYYNWKPGSYTDAYVEVLEYKLKADAPDDAVAMLSEHLIVPSMEKLLADGSIQEYEIDEAAIHSTAPGMFFVVYIAPKPEGIDAVQAAIAAAAKAHVLGIQAFGSMVDMNGHRDELGIGSGTFK